MSKSKPKLSVLLNEADEARFCAYCAEKGFKKSTLIARLVREHLDREGYLSTRNVSGSARRKATARIARRHAAHSKVRHVGARHV
jgi:hypothetical protein